MRARTHTHTNTCTCTQSSEPVGQHQEAARSVGRRHLVLAFLTNKLLHEGDALLALGTGCLGHAANAHTGFKMSLMVISCLRDGRGHTVCICTCVSARFRHPCKRVHRCSRNVAMQLSGGPSNCVLIEGLATVQTMRNEVRGIHAELSVCRPCGTRCACNQAPAACQCLGYAVLHVPACFVVHSPVRQHLVPSSGA